jgi:hypothetical protein
MLLEKLWLAKINSIAQSGTITALSTPQYKVAEAIIPKASTHQELVQKLKELPWSPILYTNPHNWQEEKIINDLSKRGLLSLAKVIIERN